MIVHSTSSYYMLLLIQHCGCIINALVWLCLNRSAWVLFSEFIQCVLRQGWSNPHDKRSLWSNKQRTLSDIRLSRQLLGKRPLPCGSQVFRASQLHHYNSGYSYAQHSAVSERHAVLSRVRLHLSKRYSNELRRQCEIIIITDIRL